jgi:hypothetical protein
VAAQRLHKRQLEPRIFPTFTDQEIVSHEIAPPFNSQHLKNTYKLYKSTIVDFI